MAAAIVLRSRSYTGKQGNVKQTHGSGIEVHDICDTEPPDEMNNVDTYYPLTDVEDKYYQKVLLYLGGTPLLPKSEEDGTSDNEEEMESVKKFTSYQNSRRIEYTPSKGFNELGMDPKNNEYSKHFYQNEKWTSSNAKNIVIKFNVPSEPYQPSSDSDESNIERIKKGGTKLKLTTMIKTKKKKRLQKSKDDEDEDDEDDDDEDEIKTGREFTPSPRGINIVSPLDSIFPVLTLIGKEVYLVNYKQNMLNEIIIPKNFANFRKLSKFPLKPSFYKTLDDFGPKLLKELHLGHMVELEEIVDDLKNNLIPDIRKWIFEINAFARYQQKLLTEIDKSIISSGHIFNPNVGDSEEIADCEQALKDLKQSIIDNNENLGVSEDKTGGEDIQLDIINKLLASWKQFKNCSLLREDWYRHYLTATELRWYLFILNTGIETTLKTLKLGVWSMFKNETDFMILKDILNALKWVALRFLPVCFALYSRFNWVSIYKQNLSVSSSNVNMNNVIKSIQYMITFWNDVMVCYQSIELFEFSTFEINIDSTINDLLDSFDRHVKKAPSDVVHLLSQERQQEVTQIVASVWRNLVLPFAARKFVKMVWFDRVMDGVPGGPGWNNTMHKAILCKNISDVDCIYRSVMDTFLCFFEQGKSRHELFELNLLKGIEYVDGMFIEI